MGQDTLTHRLITALRQTFSHTAVLDTLWSDGGPQFTANAFKIFATQWRFTHRISSPRYPQSNGKIEATVKSMKKILAASWDHRHLNKDKLCRALLQYHNMPSCKDRLSPAQKLFSHPIQDTLPAHRCSFALEWQKGTQEAEQQVTETLEQSKTFYNIHAHSLPDICIGSPVALQGQQTKLWDVYGTVVAIGPYLWYYVKTHSGHVLVCNRRFLQHRIYQHHFNPLFQHIIQAHPINIPPHQQILHRHQHLQNLPSIHTTPCDPAGHPQGLWKILTGHIVSIGADFNTPMLGGDVKN